MIGALIALGVLLVHAALRAYGLFGEAGARPFLVASFVLLWLTPWICLRKEERADLGFARLPGLAASLMWICAGGLCAAALHFAFFALYGLGAEHAYSSVRATMFNGVAVPELGDWALFAMFAAPGLIFSPIGEEFFCRGVLARLGARAWGKTAEIALPAAVFAGLHIMHHGLDRDASGAWIFMAMSGALWVSAMFVVSVLFSVARMRTGSIWAAVFCHAGFNLAMTAAIFLVFGKP